MKSFLQYILVLSITFKAQAQIPTASLIAYYPFCGNANDLSGTALQGTVVGASLSVDRFGNASNSYSFNGTTDYISLPATNLINRDVYSYSIWIKPTSTAVSIPYSVGSNDPFCQSLSFNSTSVSASSYNIGNNPVQSYVFSNTLPGINNWIHIVVTRDLTVLKMYVNNNLISILPTANTNSQSASYGSTAPYRAILGARSTLAQYFYEGLIDDVRIYSTVLSSSDVNALYNEAPASIIAPGGSVCQGNSFIITPSGGSTYTFSSGSATVTPTNNTSYTVSGNSSIGCQLVSATVNVIVNPNPTIIVNSGIICKGQSFSITPSGALTYTISGGSGLVTPGTNTNYTVTGNNSSGCTGSAIASVSVNICEGISEELSSIFEFSVCPNPSAGSFILKLNAVIEGSYIIEDLQGRIIIAQKVEKNSDHYEVDKNIEPGYYIIRLFTGTGVFSKKIIITR